MVGVGAQPAISSRQNTEARVNKNPNARFGSDLSSQASVRPGSQCTRRNLSVNITLQSPSLSAARAVSKDRTVLFNCLKKSGPNRSVGPKEGADLRCGFLITKLRASCYL